MKGYDVTFFCDKGKGPKVHIHWDNNVWPVTIFINQDAEHFHEFPRITLFLESFQDLINFKNSVDFAYNNLINKRDKNV